MLAKLGKRYIVHTYVHLRTKDVRTIYRVVRRYVDLHTSTHQVFTNWKRNSVKKEGF